MLESNNLLRNLLEIATKPNQEAVMQNLSLDILMWILSIRLARYRCPRNHSVTDINSQQNFCVNIVEKHLNDLILNCILMNNRSIAHKCVKLIIATLHGAQNIFELKHYVTFEYQLKCSLIQLVPEIKKASHAGAVRWFTTLISATSNIESQTEISKAIMQLLTEILHEIGNRPNTFNSVLQSRFGLYGMPFESELFDSELPWVGKNSNVSYYNMFMKSSSNAANNTQQSQHHQNQFSDLKNFCTADTSELKVPIQMRRKSVSNHIKGLLEVEPLHFTCCETSEATRIENMDVVALQSNNVIDDIVVSAPQLTSSLGNSKMSQATVTHFNTPNIVKMDTMDKSFTIEGHAKSQTNYKLLDKFETFEKICTTLNKQKLKESKSLLTEPIHDTIQVQDAKAKIQQYYNNMSMSIFTGDEELMMMQQKEEKENAGSLAVENTRNHGSDEYKNKVREFVEESNKEDSSNVALPWHRLLSTPPKQMIVVDRMHSGARRHVTIDFGYPILLTDLVIPSCTDLTSLTIDVWCFDEDSDTIRLAVSQDIGTKSLILSDLQPPPICRYLKITFIGRLGMSATRCKLPMGTFYGHVMVLNEDSYSHPVMKLVKNKKANIKVQLKVLNALYEDTHCRYCLASSKLYELLQLVLKSDNSNMSHMQTYLNRTKDPEEQNTEFNKISAVYEECIAFQNQLNIVKNVIRRLKVALNEDPVKVNQDFTLQSFCTDKLRVMSECLVELLLHFIAQYGSQNVSNLHNYFDFNTCNLMFKTLVINGDSHIRLATCSLLVRMCSFTFKPWWGDFFSNIFTSLFSSQNVEIFPQDR
jgi:baculoviral IAP repeat-containing protein 6 (apollon)